MIPAESPVHPSPAPSVGAERFWFMAAIAVLVAGSVVADIYPLLNGDWFIGHADQANLTMLARNLAEGRGAVVDAVWLLTDGGMPGNSVTHPEDYRAPLKFTASRWRTC